MSNFSFRYVRICNLDNPEKIWLNYLLTVETLIRRRNQSELGLHCLPAALLVVSRLKWANETYLLTTFNSFTATGDKQAFANSIDPDETAQSGSTLFDIQSAPNDSLLK